MRQAYNWAEDVKRSSPIGAGARNPVKPAGSRDPVPSAPEDHHPVVRLRAEVVDSDPEEGQFHIRELQKISPANLHLNRCARIGCDAAVGSDRGGTAHLEAIRDTRHLPIHDPDVVRVRAPGGRNGVNRVLENPQIGADTQQ